MKLLSVAAALALVSALPLAAQRPGGLASPRDSAVQAVSGAQLKIDYGRPSKRGRVIWGGLVPWDRVWRTGANEATHFITDKDLLVGGTTVPAGRYTLYTLPAESGAWKLIINKQTGQWGTAYSQEQDLARVDMKVEKVSRPVEQFTIKIEPQGKGGVIRLVWDTAQASVPFTVK